mmetsp:Transcript_9798/g.59618  ORF Transcript_9798/g.59618 Transcript_9798/m.59618 type:complete len:148 (+) Transcript_9798:4156-4599(+)
MEVVASEEEEDVRTTVHGLRNRTSLHSRNKQSKASRWMDFRQRIYIASYVTTGILWTGIYPSDLHAGHALPQSIECMLVTFLFPVPIVVLVVDEGRNASSINHVLHLLNLCGCGHYTLAGAVTAFHPQYRVRTGRGKSLPSNIAMFL